MGLLVAAYALPASANTVTFDLDTLFAGTTPAGAAPWVTVSFTDVKKNHVRVTLNAAGLKGHEFLAKDALLFELAMLPSNIRATFLRGDDGIFSFSRRHRFRADGRGQLNAMLAFPTWERLAKNQRSVWMLSGKGLSTADILAFGGSTDEPIVASLIQGIGKHAQRFGWVTPASTIPVPAAVWLFGGALAGLGFLSRRRAQSPGIGAAA